MERHDIERLRAPNFTIARRGYDQREVDKLLESLVDWLETDAAKDLGDLAVTRKLELVGKSTARILLTAEEEAAQFRRATEEECEALRARAEAAALKIRQAADEYASNVRARAEEESRRTNAAARSTAKEIVEEGERRRAQAEAVVTELESHRDHTVRELDRLRAELAAAIGTHSSDTRSPKRSNSKRNVQAEPAKDADADAVAARAKS